MRHRKQGRKFGRKSNVRKAFIKSLVVALIDRGQIKTTEARAKSIRSVAEKLVTTAKKGDLASTKRLYEFLPKKSVLKIKSVAKKNQDRPGGYTRITKTLKRANDKADMAIIEFI